MRVQATCLLTVIVMSAPASAADARREILATCYDNIDGQLSGDVKRVARSMHPEMIARAVNTAPDHMPLSFEAETRDDVIRSTREGILKKPRQQWNRKCTVLDYGGNAASVRLETPEFVSFDHLGKFDGNWLIVSSFWYYKPAPRKP